MKKLLGAALLIPLLLLGGCSGGQEALPEAMDEQAVLAAGEAVLEQLVAGEYEAVHDQLREDVRADLTPADLEAVMVPVLEEAGTFQSVEESSAYGDSEEESLAVADFSCGFSKEEVRVRVVFDPEMTLTGFSVGVEGSTWSFSNLVDNLAGLFGR